MSGGQPGRRGGAVSHGEAAGGRTKEFRAWLAMRLRCKQKPHYIEKGVTVCDEWEQSFDAFLAAVGRAPSPGHSLDRFPNPEGNYEPGNVRWATKKEQRHNRRADSKVSRPWLGKHRDDMRRNDATGQFMPGGAK